MGVLQAFRPFWVWGLFVLVWLAAWWLQLELPALEYSAGWW